MEDIEVIALDPELCSYAKDSVAEAKKKTKTPKPIDYEDVIEWFILWVSGWNFTEVAEITNTPRHRVYNGRLHFGPHYRNNKSLHKVNWRRRKLGLLPISAERWKSQKIIT